MTESVIALAILLCLFFAALSYYSPAPFLIKLITLPSLCIFLIFTVYLMIIKAGAPIKKYPEGDWVYVHHTVELDENNDKYIYLWSNEKIGNRLYVIPYERETAKKLEAAKGRNRFGYSQQGNFSSEEDGARPTLFISDPSSLQIIDIPKNVN